MAWTSRLVALGAAAAGGMILLRLVPIESRHRLTRAAGDWMSRRMIEHMGRMISSLPEGAPPKLVMTILPRLQAQNEQMIAMLQEQNELLRRQQQTIAR